jgi:hypothetical protein
VNGVPDTSRFRVGVNFFSSVHLHSGVTLPFQPVQTRLKKNVKFAYRNTSGRLRNVHPTPSLNISRNGWHGRLVEHETSPASCCFLTAHSSYMAACFPFSGNQQINKEMSTYGWHSTTSKFNWIWLALNHIKVVEFGCCWLAVTWSDMWHLMDIQWTSSGPLNCSHFSI